MANPFRQAAVAGREVTLPPMHSPPAVGPRRLRSGTEQQVALWAELLRDTQSHSLVEARAGTGKSSTAREGQRRLIEANPTVQIRYAVFNKQNAVEFQADCPPGVDVGTVHSFGYQVLQRSCRSSIEKLKTYLILDEFPEGRRLPKYLRRVVSILVGHAKNQALTPDQPDLLQQLKDLLLHFDVNSYGREDWAAELAARVLRRSAEWTELVDFDDMIWLPGIHRLEFPHCDILFLDEVQDWNPAQHRLIPQLCRSGRVVALGDRYQSIYAFRGADADSIPRLERTLGEGPEGVTQLPLTVTWRCPASHVRLAQRYVADIEAHPSAKEGTVRESDLADALAGFAPGHMVLCKANAPLVSCALRLIAEGRRALVRGRAIGDQLTSVLRAAGADTCRTITELSKRVQDWEFRELNRLADLDGAEDLIESVQDRAAGVSAVLASCDSPGQVESRIAELFDDSADPKGHPTATIFSTVHRAKGLEANTVWLLDTPTRQPRRAWEAQAQRNLHYVALTRAKDTLTFVRTETERK